MVKFPEIAGIDFTPTWGRVVTKVVVMTSINHIIYIIS